MLYILKIPTEFGVVSQSFCPNQNPVQRQDEDQDHNFTSSSSSPFVNIHQKKRIFFSLMRLQYFLFLQSLYVMRKEKIGLKQN